VRSATADAISMKIKKLPSKTRQEVYDFIEFLMTRQSSAKTQKSVREKLLSVSVWTNKDLAIFDEIGKDINKWNIEKL